MQNSWASLILSEIDCEDHKPTALAAGPLPVCQIIALFCGEHSFRKSDQGIALLCLQLL